MVREQDSLHHATLLVGALNEAQIFVASFSKNLGIKLDNNPDFFVFKNETFGIEEARELRKLSTRKAFTKAKIFLITSTHLSLEAENALLKTFEDPNPDTYFFVVTREEVLVAPTLRSRMQIVKVSKSLTGNLEEANEFLKLSVRDRLKFAEKFVEEGKSLVDFLDGLLVLVKDNEKDSHVVNKTVNKVYKMRRIIKDVPTASRMIIEHLALVLI